MSLLKNSLNQEFYKWIDDVRRSFRKKDELEQELKEYERRLNGYNAVSYNLIGARGEGITAEDKILLYLSKIEDTNNKLQTEEITITEYTGMLSKFGKGYIAILTNLVDDNPIIEIAKSRGCSIQRIYQMINIIIVVWGNTKIS